MYPAPSGGDEGSERKRLVDVGGNSSARHQTLAGVLLIVKTEAWIYMRAENCKIREKQAFNQPNHQQEWAP